MRLTEWMGTEVEVLAASPRLASQKTKPLISSICIFERTPISIKPRPRPYQSYFATRTN
jgi:hypothetical protein